jgi:hypothetical protein
MVVPVVSSPWSGRDQFLTPRRVFVSEERLFQNARSFSQRLREDRSRCQKVINDKEYTPATS